MWPSKRCFLTTNENSIIDGCLLGDGSIVKSSGISARFKCGSKHRTFIERLKNRFLSLEFSPINSRRNTKVGMGNSITHHLASKSYIDLMEVRNKWYGINGKQVPEDLEINSLCLYYWWIGDGNLTLNRYKTSGSIIFCTDSFNKKSLDILCEKIKKFFSSIHIIGKQYKRLSIGMQDKDRFYNFIGECRDPEYIYKWKLSRDNGIV